MSSKPKQKHSPIRDSFATRVRTVVRGITRGTVRTYAQVATAAGSPKAARAVGTLMAKNFDPEIPCHRVVRSDGLVGAYNRGGQQSKAQLLAHEGVRTVQTAAGVYIISS
jgi:O-6-methylguanine DNA methyltransferase